MAWETRSVRSVSGAIWTIMVTLEEISTNQSASWSDDNKKAADALFITCSDFDFIIALVTVQNVFNYTHSTTVKLQWREGDILKAYTEIDVIKNTLQNKVRKNIDKYHTKWFAIAVELGKKVNVLPTKPRTCSHQTLRSNVPADTPLEYFRKSLTIPFVDHLLMELNARFNRNALAVAKGFALVPTIMKEKIKTCGIGSWKFEL